MYGDEFGLAVFGGEDAIGIEAAGLGGIGFLRGWPLETTVFFDCFIGHAGVIAEAVLGDDPDFVKGVGGARPVGEKLFAATELIGDDEEDIEVGLRLAGRRDGGIGFADAAFGV